MYRRHLLKSAALISLLATGSIASAQQRAPAVYAMTNAADGNEIVVYAQNPDGTLSLSEVVGTEGLGSGGDEPLEAVDALGSQSPLLLSDSGKWLFAVNAGSNEISVFEIGARDLLLKDIVPSGGEFPTSLTLHDNVLYVMNAALDGNITGFQLSPQGALHPIAGSTRSLAAGGDDPPDFLVSPAQVGFSPNGEFLLVTIKGSNEILVYSMDASRRPSAEPVRNTSVGTAPFGFDFDASGNLIVAEPFGRRAPRTMFAGAASSYRIAWDGSLDLISRSVENMQTATCWMNAVEDLGFAYATNNGSSTVTGYRVSADGSLDLLDASGFVAVTGENPVDLAVSSDNRFLYTVNAGAGTISAFAIDPTTGALTDLGDVDGLPEHNGAVGIAAR